MMDINSNPVKFFNEFKKLEAKLRKMANLGDDASFSNVLDRLEDLNFLIKSKKPILKDLNALRNIFAHADRERYIAEVNRLAFSELKKIQELLDNPPKVGNVFRKEVYCVSLDDITEVVLGKMKNEIYTHVPVYDGDRFYGVFSESTILAWLVDNIREGQAQFYKKQIRDVKREYLFPQDNIVKIIHSDKSIYEIPSMFEQAITNGLRLGALLITETGKGDEKPVGIITAWDLPSIDSYR